MSFRLLKKNLQVFLLFFIPSFFYCTDSSAQADCRSNCHSGAVKIERVYLADIDGNPLNITCNTGQPVTGYLWMDLSTQTSRRGIFLSGNIEVSGVSNTGFAVCLDVTLSTTNNNPVRIQEITWNCGHFTKLTNVYAAWNTGNVSQCPNSCPGSPAQCWTQEPLEILIVEVPGLAAGFTTTTGTCTNSTRSMSFTGEASGGTPGYTYSWDFGDNSATATGLSVSHDFVSGSSYTVSLTVTDVNVPMNTVTIPISVNVPACCTNANPGAVSGTSPLCIGASFNFTSSGDAGGVWSSSDETVATVDAGGAVHALKEGAATISYTVTGCTATAATFSLTVSADVTSGVIAGTSTLCINGNSTFTSNGTPGGTWSSSDETVATVDASGVVNALKEGSATISYTVTGCTAIPATFSLTVSPNVSSGTISGRSPLCINANATFTSDGTTGGIWSSSDKTVATVDAGGAVTALKDGSTTISYTVTGCTATPATLSLTVSPNVTSGTISGSSPRCIGVTSTFTSDGTAGGTWSSSDETVATVNASTGVVNTLKAGITTISYTVTGCNAPKPSTLSLTVSPDANAGSISGATPLCKGSGSTFSSNGDGGGSWSSSDLMVATVNGSTGAISPLKAGTTTISYTVMGCNAPKPSTLLLTVSPDANAGSISGATPLCKGLSSTFSSNGDGGGNWSSSDPTVATVNTSTGEVKALKAGPTTISYTVTGCNGPAVATFSLTVSFSGDITGTSPICIKASSTFTSNGTTGTWSSSDPSVATVNASTGVVTAVNAGSIIISYSATGCNATPATYGLTVSPNVTSGTITGTSPLCIGATATFTSNGTSGGIWSSSNTNVATVVASTGAVSAANAGTTTISYAVTGCNAPANATKALTVNPFSICAKYNGDYFANTGSTSTGGSAIVMLIYNISTNGSCSSITSLTADDFNLGSDGGGAVSNVVKTYSAGVLTITAKITVPSNQYSITVQFTLGVSSNYSISGDCSDNPLITVSSKSSDFVTGGGYIIPTASFSKKANSNANGLKNNFGFNVKWNKGFTNLQGNFNTIIRRMESNGVHLYQVKSSKPSTLVVKQLSPTSYRADITFTAANIQDLTLGLSTGDGPGIVYLTVIDNGEPGSNGSSTDQVLITVKDKSKNLWYTSDVTANNSVSDYTKSSTVPWLTRGNVQVHTSAGAAATQARTTLITDIAPATEFNLAVLPNPSSTDFTLQAQSLNKDKMRIRVTDIAGRNIEVIQNISAGQTLKVGGNYPRGTYFAELVQGRLRKVLKLVKM